MKMRIIRRKKVVLTISVIWLIGILSSCGVAYKLKPTYYNFESSLLSEINKDNSVIFIHVNNELFQLKGATLNDMKLEGTYAQPDEAELTFYKRFENSSSRKIIFEKKQIAATRNRYKNTIQADTIQLTDQEEVDTSMEPNDKIHQVHAYVNKINQNDHFVQIDLKDITDMEILKRSTRAGYIVLFTILGIPLLFIILLAIACNCPHVYLENGSTYSYTNTLFTGAVSKGLERFDYKLIPDFHPTNSTLNMLIKNEDQESQYTNVLQLIAAYHAPSFQVLTDQHGQLYSISNEISASSAKDQNGMSIRELVAETDGAVYEFDSPSKNGVVSSFLAFDHTQSTKQAKLVLNLQNSDWAGFIHQEFTRALGSQHQKWVAKNRAKNASQQLQEMREAGIPLIVYIKKNNKWIELETIQPIGNAGMQSLVVPIDGTYLTYGKVEIRIDASFRLWTLDRVSMDFSTPQAFETQKLNPTFVSGDDSNLQALVSDDEKYLTTSAGSAAISVQFNGLKTANRTLFIQSKGFYIRQDVQTGNPAWAQLAKLSRNHGIARFSQDVFFKYIHPFEQLSVR
jgi:hypothetical protein